MEDAPTALPFDPPVACARLCVLASGSSGNCTVLAAGGRVMLIDAGLSPRKTRRLLAALGLSLEDVTDLFITHLDHDHWHGGWIAGLPARAVVRMHRRHADYAARAGYLHERTLAFDGEIDLGEDFTVAPTLLQHDALGVTVFRFEFSAGGALGFATDVGRSTPRLVEHLRGVDVLAIESNYCPRMQVDSARPAFLKARIMGGAGHLSNAQCAEAARAIGPAKHVVLLHLSRDCNRPDLAAEGHRDAPYGLTLSSQHEPTPWIEIAGPRRGRAGVARAAAPFQPVLFA